MFKRMNLLGFVLLAACVGLWYTAPFMAFNMMTLADQPAACELFMEPITYQFDLVNTPPYLTALLVLAGIGAGLLFALIGLNRLVQLTALLAEFVMAWGFYQMYLWTEGSDYLMDSVGFWASLHCCWS